MNQQANKIIAQCIATAGWGTSHYDRESGECEYESYAGVDHVISNAKYWEKYDSSISVALFADFDGMHGFNTYLLTAYEDGSTAVEKRRNGDKA